MIGFTEILTEPGFERRRDRPVPRPGGAPDPSLALFTSQSSVSTAVREASPAQDVHDSGQQLTQDDLEAHPDQIWDPAVAHLFLLPSAAADIDLGGGPA